MLSESSQSFLFNLLGTPSPSGFEAPGQRVWADYVRSAADTLDNDHYGNTWAVRNGASADAPRVMLEAHADEIGFMVSHVTDEGFLHVQPIGGSDKAVARARRVQILGPNGPVPGVIGNTAIHLRDRSNDKVPDWHDLYVDIGATSKDEVTAQGIRVGHPIVYADTAERLGEQRLVGRALDNRIGGFTIAQVLHRLAKAAPTTASVYAVNAVQEEIGGNGARMVTYRLEPHVAVVLDVTHATGSPGISKPQHGAIKLGDGPTLTHGTANHPLVIERLMSLAKQHDIPLQHEASSRSTGTDTDDIFTSRMGVPSALVSLPMRYMHSTVEMVDLRDVEHCVTLLTAFAQSVQADDTFRHVIA